MEVPLGLMIILKILSINPIQGKFQIQMISYWVTSLFLVKVGLGLDYPLLLCCCLFILDNLCILCSQPTANCQLMVVMLSMFIHLQLLLLLLVIMLLAFICSLILHLLKILILL